MEVPEESHKGDQLSFETAGTVAVRVHTPMLANILNGSARWASVGGRHTARGDRPPCPSTRTLGHFPYSPPLSALSKSTPNSIWERRDSLFA